MAPKKPNFQEFSLAEAPAIAAPKDLSKARMDGCRGGWKRTQVQEHRGARGCSTPGQPRPQTRPHPSAVGTTCSAPLLRKGSTISHLLVCILSGNHKNPIFCDETETTLFPGRCLLSFPRLVTRAHSCFFLRRGISARKRITQFSKYFG